jgi:hypothetical protein
MTGAETGDPGPGRETGALPMLHGQGMSVKSEDHLLRRCGAQQCDCACRPCRRQVDVSTYDGVVYRHPYAISCIG